MCIHHTRWLTTLPSAKSVHLEGIIILLCAPQLSIHSCFEAYCLAAGHRTIIQKISLRHIEVRHAIQKRPYLFPLQTFMSCRLKQNHQHCPTLWHFYFLLDSAMAFCLPLLKQCILTLQPRSVKLVMHFLDPCYTRSLAHRRCQQKRPQSTNISACPHIQQSQLYLPYVSNIIK